MPVKRGGQWKTDYDLWVKLKPLARQHRHEATKAEASLWECLRDHRLGGHRFRRQHTIGRFIVDFYCAQKQLVIEVDGPIHDDQVDEDAVREEFLTSLNLRVIRFKNDEVIYQLPHVLDKIAQILEE